MPNMPVDEETSRPFPGLSRKVDMRHCSSVNRPSGDSEALCKYAEFIKPLRKLKSDHVPVHVGVQLDLEFKSHRHVDAPTCEVIRLYRSPTRFDTACDSL